MHKIRTFFWHSFWTDPKIFFSALMALLINITLWISVYVFVEPTELNIVLHYNIYFGIDEMGSWKKTYLFPAVALGLFFCNIFLSRFLYYRERLASYLLSMAALIIQLVVGVGLLSIIMINY